MAEQTPDRSFDDLRRAEQSLQATIDQEWTRCVEIYYELPQEARDLLSQLLLQRDTDLLASSTLLRDIVLQFASTAFIETFFRWNQRRSRAGDGRIRHES